MAKEIKWTKSALADLDNVHLYLTNNWPDFVTEAFFNKLNSTLSLLAVFPDIGEQQQPDIHAILITKHNKLFYRISEKSIIVLRLFDTRQHPGKLKLK